MNRYVKNFLLFVLTTGLLSSCTFNKPNTEESSKIAPKHLQSGDADGFAGGDADGFAGLLKPSISRITVPNIGELKKGSVISIAGTNFTYGITVSVAGVSCDDIKVLDVTALTCTLSELVSRVTTVTVKNPSVEETTEISPLVVVDLDGDGILDEFDNCLKTYNPGQERSLNTEGGDACGGDREENDDDHDGVSNYRDNCRDVYNPDQETLNNGSFTYATACPPNDSDEDGVYDNYDNCPEFNPDQETSTVFNQGRIITYVTACPVVDADEDGIFETGTIFNAEPYAYDNCPSLYNPYQEDLNSNGIGDLCEPSDIDLDGVYDTIDNCSDTFNPGQEDSDANGIGDACDIVVEVLTD